MPLKRCFVIKRETIVIITLIMCFSSVMGSIMSFVREVSIDHIFFALESICITAAVSFVMLSDRSRHPALSKGVLIAVLLMFPVASLSHMSHVMTHIGIEVIQNRVLAIIHLATALLQMVFVLSLCASFLVFNIIKSSASDEIRYAQRVTTFCTIVLFAEIVLVWIMMSETPLRAGYWSFAFVQNYLAAYLIMCLETRINDERIRDEAVNYGEELLVRGG